MSFHVSLKPLHLFRVKIWNGRRQNIMDYIVIEYKHEFGIWVFRK